MNSRCFSLRNDTDRCEVGTEVVCDFLEPVVVNTSCIVDTCVPLRPVGHARASLTGQSFILAESGVRRSEGPDGSVVREHIKRAQALWLAVHGSMYYCVYGVMV